MKTEKRTPERTTRAASRQPEVVSVTPKELEKLIKTGEYRTDVQYSVRQAPKLISFNGHQHMPFVTHASDTDEVVRTKVQVKTRKPSGRTTPSKRRSKYASRTGVTKSPGEVLPMTFAELDAAVDAGLIPKTERRRHYHRIYQDNRRNGTL